MTPATKETLVVFSPLAIGLAIILFGAGLVALVESLI